MKYTYMRTDTEDKYNIKKLQDKILEIMVYIDRICQENNIEYFLMGGSALGAIRHEGFIPWDDDMDIYMKSSEYKKFKKCFDIQGDKEKYYLQELFKRDDKIASAKLRLNNSTYIENATRNMKIHHGIFIDIFILHNASNMFFSRFIQCLSAKYILAVGQGYKDIKYKGIKKIARSLAKIVSNEFLINKCYKKLFKYNRINTKYVCDFMGPGFYKKSLFKSKYFSRSKRVKFENIELNIPEECDEYLKDRFGNYMTLPSEESIKNAQHAVKWKTDKDFSNYVNKKHDFSDEKILV